jgi:hypothetical protein
MKSVYSLVLALLLAALWCAPSHAELPKPENPRWEPIADDVYLQDFSKPLPTEQALLSVAVHGGKAYVGDGEGLSLYEDGKLTRLGDIEGPVNRLKVIDDTLWIMAGNGLWSLKGASPRRAFVQSVNDVCSLRGQIYVVKGNGVYSLDNGELAEIATARAEILGIAIYSENLYVRHAGMLGVVQDGGIDYQDVEDWGKLPHGCTVRDFMPDGSRLLTATDEGLSILRGMTWYHITGKEGLPVEDTTSLAEGFADDLWIGTKRGAIRFVDGEYRYYGYQRWLPNGQVNAIAAGDNVVYVATEGGLGVIEYEPYTLEKKAAYYERWLEEWGHKRMNFTHGLMLEDGEYVREVSDNDVGYSSHYFTAQCFKYAVTGDPAARDEAVEMMKTYRWSELITSIDGFPARSIWAVGEKGHQAQHGSGGLPAEWHYTEDKKWQWKGDTSSDETDAHNFATVVFHELVAEGAEKQLAKEHMSAVFGHIVDNGYFLRDVDGNPTRWARWDPEYLQRPYGYYARGLNGMELFSYMTASHAITGEDKFAKAREQLIDFNYPEQFLRQKLTFNPDYFTHFDDRLAFYAYFPLITFEKDPHYRSMWLRSLERSWEVKRIEGLPWFNFIYGALTGNDCENERSVAHLREWPLDLRVWSHFNAHRDDLHTPMGYRMYSERPRGFSPREVAPARWDHNWGQMDLAANARAVSDPSGWLDAYWMGRYYGMIEAPTTTNPDHLTVPKLGRQLGAKPYTGPDRPEIPLPSVK